MEKVTSNKRHSATPLQNDAYLKPTSFFWIRQPMISDLDGWVTKNKSRYM